MLGNLEYNISNPSKGISVRNVQEYNRALIFRTIHNHGECSRKEISVETGLDQATITRIVSHLIDSDFVEEVSLLKNKRGRRSIGISFNSKRYRIISLRLQRRNYDIAIYDLLGTSINSYEYSLKVSDNAELMLKNVLAHLQPIAKELGKDILGIGVALPGPFLIDKEKIILMTETSGWKNFDFMGELRRAMGNVPIFSCHDANAAGLTVRKTLFNNSPQSTMLYISVGQGVGSAIIINDRVFLGSQGIAGEFGHTSVDIDGPSCRCGNNGCLEHYISTISLLRRIKNRMKEMDNYTHEKITMSFISEQYHQGNPIVEEEVSRAIKYLSQGIVNYVNLINPNVIVIGDEYVSFGQKFIEQLKRKLKKKILPSIYEQLTIEYIHSKHDIVLEGSFLNVFNRTLLGLSM